MDISCVLLMTVDVGMGSELLVEVLKMDTVVDLELTMDVDAGVGRVLTADVCEMDDELLVAVVGICFNVVTINIFPVKYYVYNNFEYSIIYLWQMFLCQLPFFLLVSQLAVDVLCSFFCRSFPQEWWYPVSRYKIVFKLLHFTHTTCCFCIRKRHYINV